MRAPGERECDLSAIKQQAGKLHMTALGLKVSVIN
jgi:hypothetical protein